MPPRKVRTVTEEELEATIKTLVTLVDRLDDAREGSAEHKMIIRQLVGALEGSQLGRLILEEYAMSARLSLP
jgi:hypothetical protein